MIPNRSIPAATVIPVQFTQTLRDVAPEGWGGVAVASRSGDA